MFVTPVRKRVVSMMQYVLYRHGSDYIEVTDTMGRYSRHTEYPMNILIVMAIR